MATDPLSMVEEHTFTKDKEDKTSSSSLSHIDTIPPLLPQREVFHTDGLIELSTTIKEELLPPEPSISIPKQNQSKDLEEIIENNYYHDDYNYMDPVVISSSCSSPLITPNKIQFTTNIDINSHQNSSNIENKLIPSSPISSQPYSTNSRVASELVQFLDLTEDDIELNFKVLDAHASKNVDAKFAKRLQMEELQAAGASASSINKFIHSSIIEISDDENDANIENNRSTNNNNNNSYHYVNTNGNLVEDVDDEAAELSSNGGEYIDLVNFENNRLERMRKQIEADEEFARQLQQEEENARRQLSHMAANQTLNNPAPPITLTAVSAPSLPPQQQPLPQRSVNTTISSSTPRVTQPIRPTARSPHPIPKIGQRQLDLNRIQPISRPAPPLSSSQLLHPVTPQVNNGTRAAILNHLGNRPATPSTPTIRNYTPISISSATPINSQTLSISSNYSSPFPYPLPYQHFLNTITGRPLYRTMAPIVGNGSNTNHITNTPHQSKNPVNLKNIAMSVASSSQSTPTKRGLPESNVSGKKSGSQDVFTLDSDEDEIFASIDASNFEANAIPNPMEQLINLHDAMHGRHGSYMNWMQHQLNNKSGTPSHAESIYPRSSSSSLPTYSSREFALTDHETKEEIKTLLQNFDCYGEDKPVDQRLPTPAGMSIELLPHQQLGVEWMLTMEKSSNKGGILADDMGLGKTVQSIGIICANLPEYQAVKSTLIVAPVSLISQWQQEINDKTIPNKFSIYIHHGPKRLTNAKQVAKHDIVLTTYQIMTQENPHPPEKKKKSQDGLLDEHQPPQKKKLKSNSNTNNSDSDTDDEEFYSRISSNPTRKTTLFQVKWHRIILDEAHIIKNRNTVSSIASQYFDAKFRWCLTGTPIQNSLDEFFPLLRFLEIRPYCNWLKFKRHISDRMVKGKSKNAVGRVKIILKACMLRRTKNYKLDGRPIINLPPKHNAFISGSFSTPEREFYDALFAKAQLQFNQYLKAGTVMKNYHHVLSWVLRLRQACCHPNLVTFQSEEPNSNNYINNNSESSDRGKDRFVPLHKANFMGPSYLALDSFHEDVINRVLESNVKEQDCSICFDIIQNGILIPVCGHPFCKECIIAYQHRAAPGVEKDCPQCRGKVNFSALVPIDDFLKKYGTPTESDETEVDTVAQNLLERFNEQAAAAASTSERNNSNSSADMSGSESVSVIHSTSFMKRERKRLRNDIDMAVTSTTSLISSTKIDKCIEIVNKIRTETNGDKVIIFSQFIGFLDMLEIPLIVGNHDFVRYDGTMDREERSNAIKRFTEDPNCNVILISLKCGSLGLNLTCANHIIMMDVWWNPAVESQAVDRAHRFGQRKEVYVHRITIGGTVEDRILELQRQKQEIINAALDEGQMRNNMRLSLTDLMRIFETD